jgi:hypothetical protein
MPMYTLTTRKGSPDRLELRYAETDSQVTLKKTDLAPFIGTWLEVTETIEYGTNGTYEIEIKKVSDRTVLFEYANNSIVNWRPGADFVRPKWGIYRSLINAQDLRDEAILFANFRIEETAILSSVTTEKKKASLTIISDPFTNTICVKNLPEQLIVIQIFSLDGRIIINETIDSKSEATLDVSSFLNGTYILNLSGKHINQSKLIPVFQNR